MVNISKTILAVLFFSYIPVAYAGGWVQPSSKGLYVQNLSYYSASKYFDNSGSKKSQPRYRKYEANPYFEYGLSDRLTAGANIFLQHTSQYDTVSNVNRTNYGIGDSEFFARSLIWKKNGFSVSAEPMVKLPSLDKKSDQPQIGNKHWDVGMGFSAGYGFKVWELDHFVNLDIGYRHRFGIAKDQVKFAAMAGFSATKNIVLTAQLFNTYRMGKTVNPAFTQSSGDDYELTKLQLSAAYKFSDQLSLSLGAFSDIDGKNVGSGSGTIFAVNKEF